MIDFLNQHWQWLMNDNAWRLFLILKVLGVFFMALSTLLALMRIFKKSNPEVKKTQINTQIGIKNEQNNSLS